MAHISRADLEAAHRSMVTALENVLWELGDVGRAKVQALTDAHWEIVTELQDKLDEPDDDDDDDDDPPAAGRHRYRHPYQPIPDSLLRRLAGGR